MKGEENQENRYQEKKSGGLEKRIGSKRRRRSKKNSVEESQENTYQEQKRRGVEKNNLE